MITLSFITHLIYRSNTYSCFPKNIYINISFISSLIDDSLDDPDLLSAIPFYVLFHFMRNHSWFLVPTHSTSYDYNRPLQHMLRYLNDSCVFELLIIFKRILLRTFICICIISSKIVFFVVPLFFDI